jgi:hypothetical protein
LLTSKMASSVSQMTEIGKLNSISSTLPCAFVVKKGFFHGDYSNS